MKAKRKGQWVAKRPDGSVNEGWKPKRGQIGNREQIQQEQLAWFLKLASLPEPSDETAWDQLTHEMYTFARWILPDSVVLEENRLPWAKDVFHQVHSFVKGCRDSLQNDKNSREPLTLPYEWGSIRFEVRGNRLVPSYENHDPVGAMLLALVTLLMEKEDLSRIKPCQICGGLFYKSKGQMYCSPTCKKQAHPSALRVRRLRQNKNRWKVKQQELSRLLTDIDAVKRKQKIQPPRSERQILTEAEKTLLPAKDAFKVAYPTTKSTTYPKDRDFLLQADKQIKQFRKRGEGS